MKIKMYLDAIEFNEENIGYLLEKEEINNLIIGCLHDSLKAIDIEKWVMGNVTIEDNVELIFICPPDSKLLIYSPTNNDDDDDSLYKFIAEQFKSMEIKLLGVKAETKIANKFSEQYANFFNCNFNIFMSMKILVLTTLENIQILNLNYRKATIDDLDTFEYGNSAEIGQNQRKFIKEGLYLLEDNGKVVSQAAIRRKMSMGGVFTPEAYRGKGYSTTLIYLLSKKLLEEGARYCVLHTDASNYTSNHIYQKIGYRFIADMADITFE